MPSMQVEPIELAQMIYFYVRFKKVADVRKREFAGKFRRRNSGNES